MQAESGMESHHRMIDQFRAAGRMALVQHFQSMNNRVTIENTEDGAAQSEQSLVLIARLAGMGIFFEQLLSLLIVEQNLAVGVTDNNPVRQFRHQGGKPGSFFVQGRLGDRDFPATSCWSSVKASAD